MMKMLLILVCHWVTVLGVKISYDSPSHLDLRCKGKMQIEEVTAHGCPPRGGSVDDENEDSCTCCSLNREEVIELRKQLKESHGCPQTKYLFPNSGQTTDYIRVKIPIQDMSNVTICAWVTPFSDRLTNGFFSYATRENMNALLLWFQGGLFSLYLLDVQIGSDVSVRQRSHLCVVVNKPQAMVYMNGNLSENMTFPDAKPIPGGGGLIIGQEQDRLLGGFVGGEAFTGTLENLMLWYRTLTADEIKNLAIDSCACPRDYGIAFTPDVIEMEGGVVAQPIDSC